jgi:hypothetical protein
MLQTPRSFNEGWHSYTDATLSTFSFLGVVSYGDAWAAQHVNVGFFTDNIPSFHAGYYTVNLTYTESTTGGQGEWKETLKKKVKFWLTIQIVKLDFLATHSTYHQGLKELGQTKVE